MDDLFLIKQVLEGNANAFRFLVIRYQRPIFKFLAGFNLEGAVMEELAQETFLKAYKNLKDYEPSKGASFSSWLFTIARNLALNESARHGRKHADEIELVEIPDSCPSQLDLLQGVQAGKALATALGQIPDPFRNALVLSYFEDLSLEEIAGIEGCSSGTVKSRIHRAKQMLRRLLGKSV